MALGDYEMDPNCRAPKGGSPGDIPHPRRCQATRFRTKTQCGKWAAKGDVYCHYHRNKMTAGKSQRRNGKGMTSKRSIYRKAVSGTLATLIDDATAAADEYDKERTNLEQEIDTARALAAQSLSLLSKVTDSSADIKAGTMLQVIQFAQNSMSLVADLMLKFQKLRITSPATIDHNTLEHFATHVERVLDDVLGEEHEDKMRQIHARMKEFVTARKPAQVTQIVIQ